jgi:hypothetical protein
VWEGDGYYRYDGFSQTCPLTCLPGDDGWSARADDTTDREREVIMDVGSPYRYW